MKTKNSDVKVVKSNAMIEASYRLSPQEQRIMLSAISQIKFGEAITDQVMYSVSVHDIASLCDLDANNLYKELEEAALRLKRREIRIPNEPNGKGKRPKILVTSWLQSIQYVPNSGTVEIRFSHDVLPYISQLREQFTVYKLKDVAKMTSSYGIRFYELLIQWSSTGSREVEVSWLKNIFLLNGKYSSIKDFKKWVLEPAVEQINKNSNLYVAWSQKKTGRIVTHICFNFGLKEDQKNNSKTLISNKSGLINEDFLSKNALPGESRKAALKRLGAKDFSN